MTKIFTNQFIQDLACLDLVRICTYALFFFRITYVNKGQFYGIGLEYAMDPEGPHIKNHTVKTVIMVLFRDGKSEDEEQKCWQFWHSR